MSIKILTKSGEEITAIDDARAYNFDAGNKSGIVKGALNEGKLFLVSSNVIGLDSCELRISGHRIVIDSAESITMANRPSVATRYSMIAEVVVSDASVPSFRLFIQPAKTELIQQNLYKTLNGNGTYQLRIGNFTLGTDGLISDIVRTADVISGATNGVGDIEFNVTTETIAGDLEPEVNVDFNEETKKYDMHFALPLSSGTSVIENGEVVKRFNADSKVDKEEGKGLSTNDFTTAEKNKLAGLSNYDDTSLSGRVSTNAENITKLQNNKLDKTSVDNELSTTSENPVQNKVITVELNKKVNKSDIDEALSETSENAVQNKVITAELNAVLLWENGNPNSNFATQTITNILDMSAYKYIVVEAKMSSSVTVGSILEKMPYVLNGTASVSRIDDNFVGRVFKIVSATSMYFDDAYRSGTKDNSLMIPYRIYGTNIL